MQKCFTIVFRSKLTFLAQEALCSLAVNLETAVVSSQLLQWPHANIFMFPDTTESA